MKCRLLYLKTVSDPSREDNGQVMPAGTIIEHPDAFWLCHTYQQLLRKLNDESFDFVQMDGKGAPLKYEAEPADQECLNECTRRWVKEYGGFKLKTEAAVVPPVPSDPPSELPSEAISFE